jgi:hypothetical protein
MLWKPLFPHKNVAQINPSAQGAPEAIDSQSEFVQFRCQMSYHVTTCIYLELIGFIELLLLKRLKVTSFWPVVSILFGGLGVVGLTV